MEEKNFYEDIANAPEGLFSEDPLTHPHGFCFVDEVRLAGYIWLKDPHERDAWVEKFNTLKCYPYEELLWKGTWRELTEGASPFACEFRGEFRKDDEKTFAINTEELQDFLLFIAEYGS